MRVLVDTSVWSLALRRAAPRRTGLERELAELIREGRVVMCGAVRQELLSGVRSEAQYRRLKDELRAWDDVALEPADYEEAARCFTRCRAAGVQGGAVDFLLCAIARRRTLAVFAVDRDFVHYARVLGVRLHEPRAG